MRPTICLAMNVQNAGRELVRRLATVADSIDYWVIVDAGSTDGTQELIQTYFGEEMIPGELHESSRKDRAEAFALAEGHADYILYVDADALVMTAASYI